MKVTGSTVSRGLVLLEPDDSDVLVTVRVDATIALARCALCGTRRRVLPCDALSRKAYGLAVIEHEVSDYSRGGRSLRQVAWSQLGERTPAHTTLHGWTEGLGAHALGRPGGELGGAPLSRLLAEAEPRVPSVKSTLRTEPAPDPRRYRSEARRERLAAVMLAMTLITLIAGRPHPHAMAECRRLSLSWSGVSVLEFPSRILDMAIEHRDRSEAARSRPSSPRSRDRCPTRTRSPPDASSRSPS
jgi:hypothetical protein